MEEAKGVGVWIKFCNVKSGQNINRYTIVQYSILGCHNAICWEGDEYNKIWEKD